MNATVSNNVTLAGAGGWVTTGTLSGSISGSGQLVEIGTGGTTLTKANTYSGGTVVAGGTLYVGSASSLARKRPGPLWQLRPDPDGRREPCHGAGVW